MGGRRYVVAAGISALLTVATGSFGCASKPPPAPEPPKAEGPAPEPAAPPPPPVTLACKAKKHVCADFEGVAAEEAAKIRSQCAAEGGEVLDACPPEKVVATCTAARAQMTVKQHVYRAKTGRETRGLVFDSKRACESRGGTFTAM